MCDTTIVVIGGGIAGISCIEGLFQDYDQSSPQFNHLILLTESRIVKKVVNYERTGRSLDTFDIEERDIRDISSITPAGIAFNHIIGSVRSIDAKDKRIVYNRNSELSYDILCICTGSIPRTLDQCIGGQNESQVKERIILIRDTSSVEELRKKLLRCRRLVIVGNGGIGLELVSKISDCEKVWIIKDDSIGYTFFDSGCAKFMLDSIAKKGAGDHDMKTDNHKLIYESDAAKGKSSKLAQFGPALGPDWTQKIELKGQSNQSLNIIQQDEVIDIIFSADGVYPLRVTTKRNNKVDCDFIAVAIGVVPSKLEFIDERPDVDASGGILIDNQMRTSLCSIYAAGDVVSCANWPDNELWFQMRLWTQARQMGYYAGRCIVAHRSDTDPLIYFNFECFTHCTNFFGVKLVLLGRYNGQQVRDHFEVIARVNQEKDYVKVLVKNDGRIVGAVLAGDSGLEETIENLIHDRIDISGFKNELLDETIDIEDYFD